jgi:phage gpG-like protein
MATDVTVVINEGALHAALGMHGSGGVGKMLARIGVNFESLAKQKASDLIYSTPEKGYIRTGRFRSSLTWRLGEDGEGPYVECGSNVEYAIFLELGTVNMAARPIIVPAAREAVAAVLGA